MKWDRDPTQHSLSRKTRVFMGMLMNLEDALQAAHYDLEGAYTFSLQMHERLGRPQAEQPAPGPLETELLGRFTEAVESARAGAPHHPHLPEYAGYASRWRQQRHPELQGLGVAPGRSPLQETDLFGAPAGHWYHLHARLQAEPKPHRFLSAYTIFLAGLQAASAEAATQPSLPSELEHAARNDLERTTAFAFQSEPQAMARVMARIPEESAFHCLLMGVAYVVANPDVATEAWLHQGPVPEQRLYLLVAMGFLAANFSPAARLVTPIRHNLPGLASTHLGDSLGALLQSSAKVTAPTGQRG